MSLKSVFLNSSFFASFLFYPDRGVRTFLSPKGKSPVPALIFTLGPWFQRGAATWRCAPECFTTGTSKGWEFVYATYSYHH